MKKYNLQNHNSLHSVRAPESRTGYGAGRGGFSLVELSIVLVIVGILLYGATSMFTLTAEKARIDATNNTLDAIERAIRLHYLVNSRIPCGTDPDGGTTLGISDCGHGNAWGDAIFGAVPARTLNLPDSYMYDGWGRPIMMFVDPQCADTDWIPGSGNAPYTCAADIVVNDKDGDERTDRAAYVLISYGKNGYGSLTKSGDSRIGTSTISTVEQENAHVNASGGYVSANSTFVDDFIRDWSGTEAGSGDGTYFDDIVRWKTPEQISYKD